MDDLEKMIKKNQMLYCQALRERKFNYNVRTEFTFNSKNLQQAAIGKPWSRHDAWEFEMCDIDPRVMDIYKWSRYLPVEKRISPETTSQEYGWISKPACKPLDFSEFRSPGTTIFLASFFEHSPVTYQSLYNASHSYN